MRSGVAMVRDDPKIRWPLTPSDDERIWQINSASLGARESDCSRYCRFRCLPLTGFETFRYW